MANECPDICYRIRIADKTTSPPTYYRWTSPYTQGGGSTGSYSSLTTAKRAASVRLGSGYQIWKFHCGIDDILSPYFMPELVLTKPPQ
jgi:hypothetical protein